MTKQRITIIGIVGLIVFGLLLGGQTLYKKGWVDADLVKKTQQIPGVKKAEVVASPSGAHQLLVETNQVNNVKKMIDQLQSVAAGMPVEIKDTRSEKLESIYEQMQFSIQEGIARGNFTTMAVNLKNQAQKAGTNLELSMDSSNIYIALVSDNHQLISVIGRHGEGQFVEQKQ